MIGWPEPIGEAKPVAEFLRSILSNDFAAAFELISKIDPNACDLQFPIAWRLVRPECKGSRLLHEAVTYSCANNFNNNDIRIVKLLLDAGANPNFLTVNGYSALHNAATVNHAPACSLLISHGAYINQQSLKGYTPMQTASLYRGDAATAVLIGAGANFKLTNRHGENAYDYAKRLNHKNAVSLLEIVKAREEAHGVIDELERDQAMMDGGGAADHFVARFSQAYVSASPAVQAPDAAVNDAAQFQIPPAPRTQTRRRAAV